MNKKARENLKRLLNTRSKKSRALGRVLLEKSDLSEEEKRELDPTILTTAKLKVYLREIYFSKKNRRRLKGKFGSSGFIDMTNQ